MELINSIFVFFTDKTKKLTHKTIMILGVIIIIILLDNTLSFSYSLIIKDSTLSSKEKQILKNMRSNIIEHKTWKDNIYNFNFKLKEDNRVIVKNDIQTDTNERNYLIHFITSSWLFMIIMFIMPFFGLLKKEDSLLSTFVIILTIELIFFGLSWILAQVFSYIPVINNNPNINYLINSILHLLIFTLVGILINKIEKNRLRDYVKNEN